MNTPFRKRKTVLFFCLFSQTTACAADRFLYGAGSANNKKTPAKFNLFPQQKQQQVVSSTAKKREKEKANNWLQHTSLTEKKGGGQ